MSRVAIQDALVNGDWATAERLLAPYVSGPGAHPSLLYNYGKVLIELARTEDAVAALSKTVAAAPGYANAWFELGRAALACEAFETAYEGFERALELAPDDRDARRNLARVALRLGRFDAAGKAWREFEGEAEADIALYRIAAETGAADAPRRRKELLQRKAIRAQVLQALVRVSKGAVPLNLRP